MAKTVYVVFDTDLEKVVGVYDNQEAADDCETAAPGDRYVEEFVVAKNYNEDEDPRTFNDDLDDLDDGRGRNSYDDDEFYGQENEEEEERDTYDD
jgi:hypothetical protein